MTGPTPSGLPLDLERYLAERDRQHAEEIGQTLAGLTDRERRLVREASVMGYVRGAMFGGVRGPDARVPRDSAIVADVVGACLAMPDLYPLLGGAQ